jgi:hypothetical protein
MQWDRSRAHIREKRNAFKVFMGKLEEWGLLRRFPASIVGY